MKLTPLSIMIGFGLCAQSLFSQTWDPMAGVWPAHTATATITASSEETANPVSLATDGDEATGWKSQPAFPSGFMGRTDRNIFLQPQTFSSITRSNSGTSNDFIDGNTSTGVNIQATQGKRWIQLNFSQARYIHLLSMKSSSVNGDINIKGYLSNGDSINIGTYTTADHYGIKQFNPGITLTGIKLSSSANFQLFEIAALEQKMYEDMLVDMQTAKEVAFVYTTFRNSQWIDSVHFDVSNDQVNWTTVAKPDHQYYFELTFEAQPIMQVRYARLRIFPKEQDYARAEVYEFSIRDRNGVNGPMPAPTPATRPLGNLMGVNGIWGWGHNTSSHTLDTTKGAYLYNEVATYGRNYQNLSWDTHDPDHTPGYNNMPGGLKQTWLNWDLEYDTWNNAGIDVQITLQFLNSTQPQSSWNNPWQAAYNIGYAFASHFGPTNGVGNVKALEVGNEPWDYDKNFYKTVLNGMAQGAKAADPALKVFSGALQSDDPSEEHGSSGNFIGERLTATEAPYLDGINAHHYSYMMETSTKQRISTYPENPLSGFRGMISDIRFRDHNMPGKEYHVTEWGWGSDGAGQSCSSSECVTEKAQAIYGARGLFMMDRLGVDRSMWYFYANIDGSGMYSRSGLTGSVGQGSVKKLSYHVFETILDKLGNSYFLKVLQEDENAWAYQYGDSLGNPAYIVAWRPVAEADPSTYQLTFNSDFTVTSAMELDGTPGGKPLAPPSQSGKTVSVQVSATPVLLTLGNSVALSNLHTEIQAKSFNMEVFPNPGTGDFKLKFELTEDATTTVRIFSLNGKLLHQQEEQLGAGAQQANMKLTHLPKGSYLMETLLQSKSSGAEQRTHKKLIITP